MQLSTSERIALTVAPDSIQLAPGSQVTVVISATNQGSVVDQFGLMVDGLDPTWFTIRQGLLNLFPSATGTFELDIHLPDGPDAVAGVHQAILRVISREAPDASASVALTIDVIAIGGIEISLTPRRRTIGPRSTAQYTVDLTNKGNADLLVDLTVRDPEEALETHLTPDRLSLPHAGQARTQLTVRPNQRPLVAIERAYSFMVEVARSADSTVEPDATQPESMGMSVGELVYRPPFASFAALPLAARRLLMALAALALLAALLIWFLEAPGRRGALIQQVPPTKPVVAAVESALSMPEKVASTDAGAGSSAGQPPVIKKFALETPGTNGRTDYALVWEVDGADKVKIGGVDQPNAQSGTMPLDKLDNSQYVLEASNGGASVMQSVGIVIIRPPEIQALSASPPSIGAGQSSTLRWQAVRGDQATLNDKAVEPSGGSMQVSPTSTTQYTLVVENELGRIERSVEVRVGDASPAPTAKS
jgi:hypothetical protein